MLCSLTNWCAVISFFVMKIVVEVSSNFGPVTFCTAADDLLLLHFYSSLEQYVTVTDCTSWHICVLFMLKNIKYAQPVKHQNLTVP